MRRDALRIALILFAVAIATTLCANVALAQDEPEKPVEPAEEPAQDQEEPPVEAEEPPEELEEAPEEPQEAPAEEKKPGPEEALPCADTEYLCGKGFTWKSEDGNHSLRVGGRFQLHWMLDNYDIHRTTRLINNSEFGIPRAYLFFSGQAARELKYCLNYRIDNGVFDDWLLTWTPEAAQDKFAGMKIDITLGHFKPRFSREFLTSSGGLSMVNRNAADAEFRLGRDYGLNFTGRLFEKNLRVDIGFSNGMADSSVDNTGSRITARLQLDLNKPPATQGDLKRSAKPRFSAGVAYSMENDLYDFDANGIYDDNGSRWTFDWALYWSGLNLIGAYFGRTEENFDTTGPGDPLEKNRQSVGYSLQGSLFLVSEKLELTTMMSFIVPNTRDTRARSIPDAGWRHENRFGFGYYIKGHSLKIQADFGVLRQRQTHGSLDDQQVRVQLTVSF